MKKRLPEGMGKDARKLRYAMQEKIDILSEIARNSSKTPEKLKAISLILKIKEATKSRVVAGVSKQKPEPEEKTEPSLAAGFADRLPIAREDTFSSTTNAPNEIARMPGDSAADRAQNASGSAAKPDPKD